jgi:hypothetical protein
VVFIYEVRAFCASMSCIIAGEILFLQNLITEPAVWKAAAENDIEDVAFLFSIWIAHVVASWALEKLGI